MAPLWTLPSWSSHFSFPHCCWHRCEPVLGALVSSAYLTLLPLLPTYKHQLLVCTSMLQHSFHLIPEILFSSSSCCLFSNIILCFPVVLILCLSHTSRLGLIFFSLQTGVFYVLEKVAPGSSKWTPIPEVLFPLHLFSLTLYSGRDSDWSGLNHMSTSGPITALGNETLWLVRPGLPVQPQKGDGVAQSQQ